MRDKSKLFAVTALVLSGAGVGVAIAAGGSHHRTTSAPCPGADGRSSKLRDCLAASLVYIDTEVGTGSGLLMPGGMIVTNAHVVDPFSAVHVVLDGGRSFRDVAVVGIDAFADIAVIGPIAADRPGIAIAASPDPSELEDADVFLVGYPGEADDEHPHIALSRGLVSRVRDERAFGFTYLQTDAAIGGGQSGGALVDEDGRVLGISGLSFAQEFALALSADDVLAAIDRITSGDGDSAHMMPRTDGTKSDPVELSLSEEDPSAVVLIPAGNADRHVELDLGTDDDVGLTIGNVAGDLLWMNDVSAGVDEGTVDGEDEFPGEPPFDPFFGANELVATSPGVYEFDAPADEDLVASIERIDDVDLVVDASVPFAALNSVQTRDPVKIDSHTRGVVDGFVTTVIHPIELRDGDRVQIAVRAGASDAYFTLVPPDGTYDPFGVPSADDGGGGLYGVDPKKSFDIDQTGTWRIVVGTYDALVEGYDLEVRRM